MNRIYTLLLLLPLLVVGIPHLQAQDGSARASEKEEDGPNVRFNGQGRTLLTQTAINGPVLDADSSTIAQSTDGEFLLDVLVNATPNKISEVQAILRLRNEFGGFFGAGQAVEVRELWGRGIIGNVLRYRLGDMDVAMTPYSLFSFQEDGTVNEPAAFQPQKEVIYYEQFYTDDNTRRLQGGKLDFGLDFTRVLNDMEASAFIARIRGTDFFTTPTRFISGGQLDFSTETFSDSLGLQADFGFNVVHTFDDLQSGNANDGIRNTVLTFDFDVALLDKRNIGLSLVGETGQSSVELEVDSMSVIDKEGVFLDVGVEFELKPQNLKFSAAFVDVGPDFFSAGAQSKRIDYEAQKGFYNRLGKARDIRQPSIFDLTKDRALYTFRVSDQLMAYDPRFNNTMPYGTATPNRRGLRLGVTHNKPDDGLYLDVMAALMSEIRGQGTDNLKDFTLIRASGNLNIHRFADWNKKLRVTAGYQMEQTSRDGEEIEQVDLSSNLIELGVEAELFSNFELLAGAKLFTAEGNEYIPEIGNFNEVVDFPSRYVVNDTETLLGAGIKYSFKKDIYLTIQYQRFDSQLGDNNPEDYGLEQLFILYNMKF